MNDFYCSALLAVLSLIGSVFAGEHSFAKTKAETISAELNVLKLLQDPENDVLVSDNCIGELKTTIEKQITSLCAYSFVVNKICYFGLISIAFGFAFACLISQAIGFSLELFCASIVLSLVVIIIFDFFCNIFRKLH